MSTGKRSFVEFAAGSEPNLTLITCDGGRIPAHYDVGCKYSLPRNSLNEQHDEGSPSSSSSSSSSWCTSETHQASHWVPAKTSTNIELQQLLLICLLAVKLCRGTLAFQLLAGPEGR
jgi:hypothetical protein